MARHLSFRNALPLSCLLVCIFSLPIPAQDNGQADVVLARLAIAEAIPVLPGLKGVEILTAEREEPVRNGNKHPIIALYGFLNDEKQRGFILRRVSEKLEDARLDGSLPWPVNTTVEVDVSHLRRIGRGQDSAVARMLLVEDFLDAFLGRLAAKDPDNDAGGRVPPAGDTIGQLRISRYDRQAASLILCGALTTMDVEPLVIHALEGLNDMKQIDTKNVLMVDATLQPNNWREILRTTARMHSMATRALGNQAGARLLDLTEKLIRRGRRTSTVWCLRAASHIMLGQDELAAGDLRLACEPRSRHRLFLNFQGPLRQSLEELAPAGPFNGVPADIPGG